MSGDSDPPKKPDLPPDDLDLTRTAGTRMPRPHEQPDHELNRTFERLVGSEEVSWSLRYRMIRPLGHGGQGVVYLTDRIGSYDTHFRLALKFFRPSAYPTMTEYQHDMARMSRVSARLSRIQQDNLVDVYNVMDMDGIEVQTMEWVDGIDLRQLTEHAVHDRVQKRITAERWDYLNDVVATRGPDQLRFKPGIAISIARECLRGLAALHRNGIVHADVKPANLMVKRTGAVKLIDMGAAFTAEEPARRQAWTPRYAAMEVVAGEPHTAASDLASLGYVLVEMLTGRLPFESAKTTSALAEQKARMPRELDRVLPPDCDHTLREFIRRLIEPDPAARYESAEEADLGDGGAADFQNLLVKGDLSSEYTNELRLWLREVIGEEAD